MHCAREALRSCLNRWTYPFHRFRLRRFISAGSFPQFHFRRFPFHSFLSAVSFLQVSFPQFSFLHRSKEKYLKRPGSEFGASLARRWSPRDSGWVRLSGYFKTEQDAWDLIDVLIPLLQLHGDIEGFNVVRTIKF